MQTASPAVSRPPQVDSRTLDSAAHYARALTRWFEQREIPRVDRQVPPSAIPSDRKAYLEIYLRDSLLWSFEEIQAARPLYAFRGLLQAAGYAGAVGNDSLTSDALLTLRNMIEDQIRAHVPGGDR